MSKEKRRFKRYKAESGFSVTIAGKSYNALVQDYSVDGLSALVQGDPPINVGDILDLHIPKLTIKTPASVVRVSRTREGLSLGLLRTGLWYGSLADFTVADLLLGTQRSGKTGKLHIKSGGIQKTVIFFDGDIIFAGSNQRGDWLGEMLQREGKITRNQFIDSSEIMQISGKRHGTVLVEMGILGPRDLFEAVIRSAELIIISLFGLHGGEFVFNDSPIAEDETIRLRLSAANLIYKGIRNLNDVEAVRALSPRSDQVICFSTDPLDLFQDLKLDPEDRMLFSMVDGRKTYKELVQGSGIDSFDAMRAFNALLSTRVIEVRDDLFAQQASRKGTGQAAATKEPSASRPSEGATLAADEIQEPVSAEEVFSATEEAAPSAEELIRNIKQLYREHKTLGYYGILEVDMDASASVIKKAYYNKAREYHPDKHFSLPEEMKDMLNVIFSYVTQAYTTLSSAKLRSEYDGRGGRDTSETVAANPVHMAAVKFEEGMVLYRGGKYEEAVQAFAEAAYLDSSNPRYHYYGALALSGAGNYKRAERTLQRAMKIEPFNADYIAEVGHIYLALNLPLRARSSFEKAVKMAPMHKRAMEGIAKLPRDI